MRTNNYRKRQRRRCFARASIRSMVLPHEILLRKTLMIEHIQKFLEILHILLPLEIFQEVFGQEEHRLRYKVVFILA